MNQLAPVILIGNGRGQEKEYYLWDEYTSYEEARLMAMNIKKDYKEKGRLKSFIVPIARDVFGLYFTRRLRL